MKKRITAVTVILLWVLCRTMTAYGIPQNYISEDTQDDTRDYVNADTQDYAQDFVTYSDASDWYENGQVKFAIDIFDDQWKELYTQEEMINACQLPAELLEKLTTEELLKLTEQYPLLGNMYEFGIKTEGLEYLADSFNGLRELLNRDDCVDVVYSEYCNLKIPEKQTIDYSGYETEEELVAYINTIMKDEDMLKTALDDYDTVVICDLLELIMLYKTTEDNVDMLLDAVMDKAEEKKKAECFEFDDRSMYISGLTEDSPVVSSIYSTSATSEFETVELHHGGVTIVVLRRINPTNNSVGEMFKQVSPYIPQGAELVELGSNAYNCHSYAWLKPIYRDTYKQYALNIVPDKYIEQYYNKYDYPYAVGAIAYKAQHSAVVVDPTNMRSGNGAQSPKVYDPIVIAKWGDGPVVKAPMSVGMFGMYHEEIENYYYVKHFK